MRLATPAARALTFVGALLLLATCEPLTAPGDAGEVVLSYGVDSVMVVGSDLSPDVAVTVGGAPLESARFRFTSSDTSVVKVSPSGDRVLATRRGRATVTVTLVSAVAQQPAPSLAQSVYVVAKHISLAATSATLAALGDTVRLRATAFRVDDQPVTGDSAFAWSSSDTSIAIVSTNGLVTARKQGAAIIRLVNGPERDTDSATVVVQQRLTRFALSPAVVQLDAIGAEVTVLAAGRDRADSLIPSAGAPTWSTDNAAVATVSALGVVTARSDGTARVIAATGAIRDTATITVRQRATDVDLFAPGGEGSPATGFRLRSLRGTLGFSASGRDSRGATVARAVPVWTSTAPRVARIDTLGTLTALDTGTTLVVARIDGAADTVTLRVSNDPAAVVVLASDTSRLASVQESMRLRARVLNAVGDSIAGVPVSWRSLDTLVASVLGDSATARGVGTARVVASASFGAVADTFAVLVTNFAASVTMARRDTTLRSVGDAFAPAVTVANARGLVVGRDAVAWSSSDTLVASVSFTGTVTARGRGRALVRAVNPSNASVRDSIAIEVTNAPASVALDVAADTLEAIGAGRVFRATVRNARGALLVGDPIAWRVDPPSIASVNDTGLVATRATGLARVIAEAGSATTGIVADTVMLDSRSVSRSVEIVTPAVDVTLTARGTGLAMAAQGRDSLGAVTTATGLRWRSLNGAVATVDSLTGAVVAVGVGLSTITVEAPNGSIDSRRVTVEDHPTRVVIVEESRSIAAVGDTYAPTVQIFNANNLPIAERGSVVWSSSDPTVVTVSASGTVTARDFGGPVYVVVSTPFSGSRDSVEIDVTDEPAAVEIYQGGAPAATLSLDAIGASAALATVVRNGRGALLSGEAVSWRGLNPAVAQVDVLLGVVTAVGVGTDTVVVRATRATAGTPVEDTLVVTVTQVAGSTVLLPRDTTMASLGHAFPLDAKALDRFGNVIPGSAVTFSSSNDGVAVVHATTGIVTANGVGTATITASVAGVPGATATVRVENRPVAVEIAEAAVTLASAGDVFVPAITVRNAVGGPIAGGAGLLTWTSGDPAVVSVSGSGTITALGPTTGGPVTVRAVNPLDPSRFDEIVVTVTNAIATVSVLDGLQRAIAGDSVHFGSSASTFLLSAIARNASGSVVSATATWGTSDPLVALVSAGGLVTAVGSGRAVITGSAGGQSDQVVIGVRRVPRTVTTDVPTVPGGVAFGAVAQARTIVATALDTAGAAIVGAAVRWSSTNPAIVSVNNLSGLVTAVSTGSASVVAAVGTGLSAGDSVRATVPVTVSNAPASVDITPTLDSLLSLQQSRVLAATILNAQGATLPATSAVWSTDDASVATVGGSGLVTAVGAGTTFIRVTSPASASVTDAVQIVIVNKPVAVTVTGGTTLNSVGRAASLGASAANGLGATIPDAVFAWTSSNDAIATVSNAGVVTAVTPGTVTITAATSDRVSVSGTTTGTATVIVRNTPATIDVAGDSLTINSLGATLPLSVTLRNDLGGVITDATPIFTSRSPSVAGVSVAGVLTGLSSGVTWVVASATNAGGTAILDSAKVVVRDVAATVTLSPDHPDSLLLRSINETATVSATVRNGVGAALPSTSAVWTTDDAAVATVSAAGVLTARGAGQTWVRAASPSDAAVRDSVSVVVVNAPTTVTVSPPSTVLTAAGRTVALGAVARNALAGTVGDATFAWTSSSDAIATVSASGLVTAVAIGTVTISATTASRVTAGGTVVGAASVEVRNAAATITITPDSVGIASIGATAAIPFTVRNEFGAAIAGATATWSSSAPGVASVDGSGVVTALAQGVTTITASTTNGSGATISDVVKVGVTNAVASVNLSPDFPADSLTLVSLGESASPAITMANGLGAAITSRSAVTWSSDNAAVASVTAAGVITAQSLGGTWVRAVSPGDASVKDSVRVRVRNDPSQLTILVSGAADTLVAPGQQLAFTAEVRNAAGALLPGAVVSWSSSDAAVIDVTTPGATATATLLSVGAPATLTASTPGLAGSVSGTTTVFSIDPTMLYVSDSTVAGGTRLGTRKRPFIRVGDAIALADEGDSVFVRRSLVGSYVENATIAIDQPIVLLGDTTAFVAGGRTDPSLLPVLRHSGGSAGITVRTPGSVTLHGFAIRHSASGPAVDADSATMVIDRVYVNPVGATPGSTTGRGFLLRNATGVTVRNSGTRLVGTYGVRVENTGVVTLEGNTIETGNGVAVAGSGVAVELITVGPTVVTGNVLARSSRGFEISGLVGTLTFTGNDVFDNAVGAKGLPTSDAHLDNWWGDALGPRRAADVLAAGDSTIFPGGDPLTFAGFRATPLIAGASVATLRVVFGNNQEAEDDTDLAKPIVVRALDARGRPVEGVDVTFSVPDGSSAEVDQVGVVPATLKSVTVRTDASGLAKAAVRTRTSNGTTTISASASGASGVSFTLTTN